MPLPTKPTSRAGMPPRRARILLGGAAKTGKTTTLGAWAPSTTLIVDTHNGTHLLDGEHYVQHVRDWPEFVRAVDDICHGGHPFHTIGLDLANHLWEFCDTYYGRVDRDTGLVFPASSQDDYGRSINKARAGFKSVMGRLLAAPVGVWFLTHLQEKTDKTGQLAVYKPDLDKNVYSYISGAADFVWLAEIAKNGDRVVHTQPTQHFEAGSRGPEDRPMPSPLPLNVAEIARALDRVLNPQNYAADGTRLPSGTPVAEAAPPVEPAPAGPDPEVAPPNPKDLGHDPEATDVPAEDPWAIEVKARIDALKVSRDDIAGPLTHAGVDVPQRIGSWLKLLTGLSREQRAILELWLEAKESEGTPLEMDVAT